RNPGTDIPGVAEDRQVGNKSLVHELRGNLTPPLQDALRRARSRATLRGERLSRDPPKSPTWPQ
ncbi:MAG TPA: hypothetical protein VN926_01975, partial [Bradyrhizobium sp.]|nr:hypothetical protein [Bradyrhizobium sp.]